MKEINMGTQVQYISAQMMQSLIQNMLDYAQIKAGKFRKNIQKFDLKAAINDIILLNLNRC